MSVNSISVGRMTRDKCTARTETASELKNAETEEKEEDVSPNYSDWDDDQLDRARATLHEAEEWIHTFDRPYAYILDRLEEDFNAGRKLSVQVCWEELRHKEWCGRNGESFALNNSLRPAISRIIVREHPEYTEKIELRRSALDVVVEEHRL